MALTLFSTSGLAIETLGSPVLQEFIRALRVKDETEKLKVKVSKIRKVLPRAEEQQDANLAVRNWLEKLSDVLYDADDLLDAISTEAQQLKRRTFHVTTMQVGIIFSNKIKAINERLDAIIYDFSYFKLLEQNEETQIRDRERDDTHSFIRAEEVIGREDDKEVVIKRLIGREDGKKVVIEPLMSSNLEEDVLILPIVGVGGMGKTSLAKVIFNDEKVQNYFDLKLWVCVSDNFDVKIIIKKILESLKKFNCLFFGEEDVEIDTLTRRLKIEIEGKKYLLVLDDVWNGNNNKWNELKNLLIGGAKGSRILVTTRIEEVAKSLHESPYHLKGLKDQASWSLVEQMALPDGKEPENLSNPEMKEKILKGCDGVPLTLKMIGGLLYFKSSGEWKDFIDNKLSQIVQKNSDILLTLKRSHYNKLSSHLKCCFAYCSLFPKGYKIDKSKLISLWIAQGFVEVSSENQCFEDIGYEYFENLVTESFFEEEKDEFGNVIGCKMSDAIHDLATLVAGSFITTIEKNKISEKTRHVSFICFPPTYRSSLQKVRRIRTFLCSDFFNFRGECDCEEIFSSFKLLRALDLSSKNLVHVPSSISELKHLRYLDLSFNNEIVKLPDAITRLLNLQTLNLQTLKLSSCRGLKELPRNIKKLVNLRHLEIDQCPSLKHMPCGLGQLTDLQTLSVFPVDLSSLSGHIGGLDELNGLRKLRGKLQIRGLTLASKYEAANLKEKDHLSSLELIWSTKGAVDDFDAGATESFQLYANLEQLRLKDYQGSSFSNWLSLPPCLVKLELFGCKKCQYLPALSSLTSLKYLSLEEMDVLQYISGCDDRNEFFSSAAVTFFPLLEFILLRECPILEGWFNIDNDNSAGRAESTSRTEHFSLPSFPRLSELQIKHCPMLTSVPMFPNLEKELYLDNTRSEPLSQTMTMKMSTTFTPLTKLRRMTLVSIKELESLSEGLRNLISLESLTIKDCESLRSLFPGIQYLTALKHLDLSNCPELDLPNDEDGMQWQDLHSLLSLNFSHLPKLMSLPSGLQHVATLQSIILDCENLMAIPDWIHTANHLNFKLLNASAEIQSDG